MIFVIYYIFKIAILDHVNPIDNTILLAVIGFTFIFVDKAGRVS